jgi:small conductance mechanosensitive channel
LADRREGDDLRRIATVNAVLSNTGTVIVVIVAGMLVLSEIGVSVAPLLATAGVAGLAIGFGAQSLIKDYFNGFFLLLEDQIREGDVVEIAGKAGEVEESRCATCACATATASCISYRTARSSW